MLFRRGLLLRPLLSCFSLFAAASRSYLHYPSSDVTSVSETIFPKSPLSDPSALMAACDATPGCIGFNENGWLKNGSTSLAPFSVDLWLLAPAPAPPAPLPLWPLPTSVSVGATPLLISSALAMTSTPPSADLSAAFARFSAAVFSRGVGGGAAPPSLRAATLRALSVIVADASAPLDLGVDESYALDIPADGSPATLRAATTWGALHGLTTLSQLVAFDADAGAYWTPAPVAIADAPAFAWRGVMVDPARAFLPPAALRAVVDSLAGAKLNVLHVHLLDCDSFPLEIEAPFERLWRGAFSPRERYTRGDMAGLVEYARQRGVRIVWEWDQPGHMGSMCVAYPDLCPTPACGAAYGSDVLDPSSNETLPVMQAVVATLAGLSIDSVLHLGGDEVEYACWLASPRVAAWMAANNVSDGEGIYRWFVQRSNALAIAAGKSPMRWEEVWRHFGAALDQRTIIHAWLSNASLIAATSAGYRAVYSVDSDSFYFDYLDVLWSDVYDVDILAGVTNTSAIPLVLGGQACLWGETVDAASLMSVLWPRAAALAERLWTNSASKARDYDVVARFAAFRCTLLERGIPAPLPGAASAGAMRPAWTVGSCSGGYRPLC